jgi:hypothetical protein
MRKHLKITVVALLLGGLSLPVLFQNCAESMNLPSTSDNGSGQGGTGPTPTPPPGGGDPNQPPSSLPVASIEVVPNPIALNLGEEREIVVTARDSAGAVVGAPSLTWSFSGTGANLGGNSGLRNRLSATAAGLGTLSVVAASGVRREVPVSVSGASKVLRFWDRFCPANLLVNSERNLYGITIDAFTNGVRDQVQPAIVLRLEGDRAGGVLDRDTGVFRAGPTATALRLTATADGYQTAECAFNVVTSLPPPHALSVTQFGVVLPTDSGPREFRSDQTLTINRGDTVAYAVLEDRNGSFEVNVSPATEAMYQSLVWSSSRPTVIRVSGAGRVVQFQALTAGQSIVEVRVQGLTRRFTINVR